MSGNGEIQRRKYLVGWKRAQVNLRCYLDRGLELLSRLAIDVRRMSEALTWCDFKSLDFVVLASRSCRSIERPFNLEIRWGEEAKTCAKKSSRCEHGIRTYWCSDSGQYFVNKGRDDARPTFCLTEHQGDPHHCQKRFSWEGLRWTAAPYTQLFSIVRICIRIRNVRIQSNRLTQITTIIAKIHVTRPVA
jgi:hypothetical protein